MEKNNNITTNSGEKQLSGLSNISAKREREIDVPSNFSKFHVKAYDSST